MLPCFGPVSGRPRVHRMMLQQLRGRTGQLLLKALTIRGQYRDVNAVHHLRVLLYRRCALSQHHGHVRLVQPLRRLVEIRLECHHSRLVFSTALAPVQPRPQVRHRLSDHVTGVAHIRAHLLIAHGVKLDGRFHSHRLQTIAHLLRTLCLSLTACQMRHLIAE